MSNKSKQSLIIAILLAAVSGSATAADMGQPAPVYTKGPPPPVVYGYSWTGCYVGGEGGVALGHSQDIAASGVNTGRDINSGFDLSGGIAGGTLGCNYQASNIVFGIEDDLSWTDTKGQAFDIHPFNINATNQTTESWIDTIRARAGLAWDRVYLYATGGGAFAKLGVNVCGIICASDSATKGGWTVGAGVEWAFWDNWSFKAEYLHADFGTTQFINPPVITPTGSTIVTRNVPVTDELFRVGLNYRFGWGGPVAARY